MPFVRTESEVRELLSAIEAVEASRKSCMCSDCEGELTTLIATADQLRWLLGEKPSQEFFDDVGSDADYNFHFVQELITRHKLGEFSVRRGTS